MENRGRYLAELRRSNAAGIHNSRPSKSQLKRQAIKEELTMSLVEDVFDWKTLDDDFWVEPTDEDLRAIEEDPENLYLEDDDPEELYPNAFDE